jgi:hypothetical protein
MESQNIIHVAIAPPDKLEADLIVKVAGIIQKDVYGTRFLLMGKIPKIVSHYHDAAEAESVARSLTDLGLEAFTCVDNQLRPSHLKVFNAVTLNFNQNGVTFLNRSGEMVNLAPDDVFLIIKGKEQTYTESGDSVAKLKLSVGKTLLAGGIPIWNKVQEKTASKSRQENLFLRLYDRRMIEPKVEILQQDIDYSFLGKELAYSSLVNFENTVNEIREMFPFALFDNKLMQITSSETPSSSYSNDIDVDCRLLCLYYLSLQDRLY